MSKQYVVINTSSGDKVRGPFTEKGAVKSKKAVVERSIQSEYINSDDLDYNIFMSWATIKCYRKDPKMLYGVYQKDEVDELIRLVDHYEKIMQIKEAKLTF